MSSQDRLKIDSHKFFSFMSVFVAAIIVLGFANTYGRRLLHSQSEPISKFVHSHALIFSSWLVVFIAQCLLVLKRKLQLHMQLGRVGILLAGAMLISGILTALDSARGGHLGIPGVMFSTREGFLLLNISSAVIFFVLVMAGWVTRKNPEAHKRFMLMATVAGLAPPGISRLPFVEGHTPVIAALVLSVVAIGPLYDLKTLGHVHRAYRFSLPLTLGILPPVVELISASTLWLQICKALI